jgi:MFS family permease
MDEPKKGFFQRWGTIMVLSIALAIVVIDNTLLNVSFATILKDLNTDIQSMQWVITAYALVLTAFTITGGRLGDIFGRKRMFVIGAVIFAIGSALASFSQNVTTLIWGEAIIEGFGAALMLPATSSLLISNYTGRDRATAFGIWGAIAGASAAFGPLVGGYLTTNYSWRWGFRINIIVVLILLLASFVIKESKDDKEKPTLDEGGILLSSVGLFFIVFAIIESSQYGWLKAKEVFSVAGHIVPVDDGYSIILPALIFGIVTLIMFVIFEICI